MGVRSSVRFLMALFLALDLVCWREDRIISRTKPRQSLHTAISSPRMFSFCSAVNNGNRFRRSRVFDTEWARAGLCKGRLLGPSMLRVINEFMLLSLAQLVTILCASGWYKDNVAMCSVMMPGVLELEERWCRGDAGALPMAQRV